MYKTIKNLVMIGLLGGLVGACDNYRPNITFSEAIKTGNEKAVNFYLKNGALVNKEDINGDFPLVLAVKKEIKKLSKNCLMLELM